LEAIMADHDDELVLVNLPDGRVLSMKKSEAAKLAKSEQEPEAAPVQPKRRKPTTTAVPRAAIPARKRTR
jgi:hypothetical protein